MSGTDYERYTADIATAAHMNNNCRGDFFTTTEPPGRWYRCLWSGEIVNAQSISDEKCPECAGKVAVSECRPVATRRVVVIEYENPEYGWDRLTEEASLTESVQT